MMQSSSNIWKIRGYEFPWETYKATGGGDTNIWTSTKNSPFFYPEDMELYLEGNAIRIRASSGNGADEDFGYYFRMGYLSDDSVTVFRNYRSRGSNNGTQCGVKFRTEEQAAAHSGNGFWNFDRNKGAGSYSMATVGLEPGTVYHVEFWATAKDWYDEAYNEHYIYPFGQ